MGSGRGVGEGSGAGLGDKAGDEPGELDGLAPPLQPIIRAATTAASNIVIRRFVFMVPRREIFVRGSPTCGILAPMVLRRFLGRDDTTGQGEGPIPAQPRSGSGGETETVRRIVAELEQMDPEQRRFLAGFAYILARAAHSDLTVGDDEQSLMEQIVTDIGGLTESQAVLVVQIAKHQTELYGGTEDFLVTREFKGRATDEQKRKVVESCFAVVAADHQITAQEYAEMTQIADELDLTREDLNAIRNQYRDHLVAIQRMRGLTT
ncbi:MAG TPA: TerB family tellurite resistance protein [Candidatus Limnocylindrales bacterium]|nr:TerB family tellurite resistance protein [Candidatus Limnocylindrales bacterium]